MGKKRRRAIPRFATPIIETHCHLDYLDAEQLPLTMQQCAEAGIERIVTIAVAPGNLDRVLELTTFAPNIWGTQGVHPHEAASYADATDALIRARCAEPRIVAVGEIGLDYYYDHAARALQREVFARQLQIAVDTALPVVIHTRDADADTRAILRDFSGLLARGGVIHSFTSSPELAQFCLAEGFMLGFNGITTFKRADAVREVVAATPAHRILLETDAPYLTPVPYRGKPNAPYFLPFIAERIAQVKDMAVEDLLRQIYRNSVELFFNGDGRLRADRL
ncbi:MAG: TatD family hydrolase [Halioglobus sp.]|nr:TatD family hydrolase [Halioglobus sp.]